MAVSLLIFSCWWPSLDKAPVIVSASQWSSRCVVETDSHVGLAWNRVYSFANQWVYTMNYKSYIWMKDCRRFLSLQPDHSVGLISRHAVKLLWEHRQRKITLLGSWHLQFAISHVDGEYREIRKGGDGHINLSCMVFIWYQGVFGCDLEGLANRMKYLCNRERALHIKRLNHHT